MNLIGTTRLLLVLFLFTKINSLPENEQQHSKPNGINSNNMRRRLLLSAGSTPVLIYKGAQPWAPLAQAKSFAVKTLPIVKKEGELDEQEFFKNGEQIHPVHATLDDFEGSGEETEVSHSNDYNNNEIPERDGNSDLHESLRQPLKRLSDRQLSVLLKQIRGQRRRQQQTQASEIMQEGQSRKSMLTELHSLLRSPSNGEKLRRPKLLTNINIIPKEWNIYPPKRINEEINLEEIENNLNKINEKNKTEDVENIKQNGENEKNLLIDAANDNITRSENRTEENFKEENENTSTEVTTTTTREVTTITTTEATTTVEVITNEIPISEDRLKEKDMADNAEFKRTTEPIKIASSKTTKTPNILSSSTDDSLHSAEIAPLDNRDKLKETNKEKEKAHKNQSNQQKSINKEKESKQTNKTKFESKKSTNKDEQRIARLTAHWRVVEQKIANEMNDAIKNSSKVIAEAEKQQQLIKEEKKSNSIAFASKTFDPTEINEENDNKNTDFENFKTAQFTALSTQLKQIRQRYEALKRQYLAKLKWLKSKKEGREKNEKGKRLDRMKAAGAPTFLDGAELDLEKVGMRRNNKTKENITIEENKQQNDTIISQPNNDNNNKTQIENHKIIETELEELKLEEDFAKKFISSNADEELKTELNERKKIGEATTNTNILENSTDTVTTVANSSTITLPLKKKKKKTQEESKLKKKKNKKPSLKSTLTELAEELNRLDERLFGDNELQINNTTIKEEKNEITKTQQIKIPKAKNMVKKKKQKIQKQQQLKKSSRVNSSPDLSVQQVYTKTNNNVSQKQQASTSLLRLEIPLKQQQQTNNNVFIDKQKQQEIPSVSSKAIQATGGRRIITSDWNPRTLLSVDNYEEENLNNGQQSIPLKLTEGTNQGISHQFDLPPSSSINNQQQQSLIDSTRKSVKKSEKHNNNKTTTQQKHPQNGQQRQNGFYQLDKAQISNVILKKNQIQTPDNSDIKLKGVSQVQVKASPEQIEETEQNEIEEQLKLEQKNKLKKEKKKNKKKKNNNNKKLRGGEKLLMEEFDELANLEDFARIDEQTICDAIACDFETGTLCEWEASIDELHPSDPRYKRYLMARRQHIMDRMMKKMKAKRSRRSADEHNNEEEKLVEEEGQKIIPKKLKNKIGGEKKKGRKKNKKENLNKILKEENNQTATILRTWHNWVGQYKNRLTGIAKSEFFSTRNQRFAASYLKPGQRSTLTGRVLSGEQANIRFWVWEATRDLQLRVCCDDTLNDKQCVLHTDKGVKRGSRRWIEQTATCPQGTKKIIFECLNLGRFQGACGLDNIQLLNNYCPSITPNSITK